MQVTCYYDYTCPYSYRAFRWLTRLQGVVDLDVAWATYSLKEANRPEGTPSPLGDEPPSISVLALALAHAAREADFAGYHEATFAAMQDRRVSQAELQELAASAGVSLADFDLNRRRWIASVVDEHAEATRRWRVFGTPSLVLDDHAVAFVKLAQLPEPAADPQVWTSLCTLAYCHPELLEIKRPG